MRHLLSAIRKIQSRGPHRNRRGSGETTIKNPGIAAIGVCYCKPGGDRCLSRLDQESEPCRSCSGLSDALMVKEAA